MDSDRNPIAGMASRARKAATLPGQIVLVLQGGGALGAYQVGVYEAMHEVGIEPAWVIGTSIGAINACLIAGNPPERRMDRLNSFWKQMEESVAGTELLKWFGLGNLAVNMATMTTMRPIILPPCGFLPSIIDSKRVPCIIG